MATMAPSWGIDQWMELLKRSVPIWPMQLRRYTEMLLPRCKSILPVSTGAERKGTGKSLFTLSGATYYYNEKTKTYTEMNIDTCSEEQLQKLESWIDASRSKIDGKQWLLVVDPMSARGEEIYPYYYVVPESKTITWVEPMDGYILFQECTTASHWNHKRLELEAQYWKHVEYFPCGMEMHVSEVRNLQVKLNWYRVGKFFDSAAPDRNDLKMAAELAIAGKLLHILRHHEYLNHHGRPEAHLVRTHSVGERRTDLEDSPFMTGLVVAMVCIPIMVLKRLRNIYVDGLVNGVDMREFTDDFSVQAKSQTTVASIIMAVNASILAVPSLGSQLTTKTLCSISFILSVYCIIGCTMAQHFGQRLRSLDFAAYYLQGKMLSLVILTSIFTADFGLPLSARLGCGLTFVAGAGLVIPLMIASLGPGLVRQ
ncbi:hypothetical protein DFH29DRAFT_881151 [Suillus ampliporus]|nr:hypothetical protein DFH29DRAFT_881151 [Suillus ampliporus]